ncbi:ATP-dependent DNA helicase RecG [Paracoccus aminovorans]|uniref:Probable DNA 3'-5' helicase RecG n=1 Tax=Paracoccus aminovorans TaxID=34004 RepID=A0A1I3C4Y9_9RHOB|nr:ATP-dependent DNA helicase RecG [Paracoccus aminovorans]CQR86446.1 ATP-dependent DNA helicase RecG [Paracoccus aminovorans]SFH69239.1 ATP-dependent DNA helicase RecG [Paracoccus aminovorans]
MAGDRAAVTPGRPEVLFPLFAGVETLAGVGPRAAESFAQMGVTRLRDVILTLPHSGIRRRRIARLAEACAPEIVTLTVAVQRHSPPTAKGRPWRVHCSDGQSDLQLVFFHPRKDWIESQLPAGGRRLVSGKLELFDGMAQMVHPDHIGPEDSEPPPDFEPVYPLSGRLTQGVAQKAVRGAMARLPGLGEWIDPALLAREGWPDWPAALTRAHAPEGPAALSPTDPARARLAYDELFAHQMTLALMRRDRRRRPGLVTRGDGRLRDRVLAGLPWPPTAAQRRAVEEIAGDMAAPRRMNRLLQGDVGSGKTLVAFLALLVAVEAGGQGVLMAPTEILARQHLAALEPLARLVGIRLEALTGRDKGDARANILADLAEGRIDILVGTHAVIQKTVEFHDLRLAIVDEQHRFGVNQRLELGAKGGHRPPDLLVMTATPIPRSLALAQFGDMDLSVLDEKPAGRQPIRTTAMPDGRMAEVVEHLARALDGGARAYWVCPLVEESEAVDLTAAQARFQELRARFGDQVRLIHGQMPAEERDAAMADFAAGRARILVATTVIEVGVNVPEATIMVIERAESFGLAQLHQLRGRVGRGGGASSCLLLYHEPLSETGRRRLSILRETEDGFRIAEEDLAMRGAGDVIGTAQSGLPRFRIADLERQSALMALARKDAQAFLERDPGMQSPRGRAVRQLLWLMEQDRAIRLIDAG